MDGKMRPIKKKEPLNQQNRLQLDSVGNSNELVAVHEGSPYAAHDAKK